MWKSKKKKKKREKNHNNSGVPILPRSGGWADGKVCSKGLCVPGVGEEGEWGQRLGVKSRSDKNAAESRKGNMDGLRLDVR